MTQTKSVIRPHRTSLLDIFKTNRFITIKSPPNIQFKFRMSSQSYSTFQSTICQSSSDSAGNSYTESTSSNPSGTTIHRTAQQAGEAPISETTRLPAGGAAGQQIDGIDNSKRIEDVSDIDKAYEEKIEDEYAKREGGA